jgi:hypothetical protein
MFRTEAHINFVDSVYRKMISLFPVDYDLLFSYGIFLISYCKGKMNGKKVADIFMKIKDMSSSIKLRFIIDSYSKVTEDTMGLYHAPQVNTLFKNYTFGRAVVVVNADDDGSNIDADNRGKANAPKVVLFILLFVLRFKIGGAACSSCVFYG